MDQRTKADLQLLVSDLRRLVEDVKIANPEKSKAVNETLEAIRSQIKAAAQKEPEEAKQWQAYGRELLQETMKLAKQYLASKENNPQR